MLERDLQPIQMQYSAGKTCYAIAVRPSDNKVLDTVSKAWVTFNAPDLARYAMAYAEVITTIYIARYPSGFVLDVNPTEFSYQQAGPSPDLASDTPIWVSQSQGQTMASIQGDFDSATKLSFSAGSMRTGLVGSSPTSTVIPTDLTETQNNAFLGRVILMLSGTQAGAAAIITGYDGGTKNLTITGLPTAPIAGDEFAIV